MRAITYTKAALKDLTRLPQTVSGLIVAKIEQLATDPASLANNVTALKGSNFKRLRVGDYRVIFTADLKVLAIARVGHRRDIYE